MKRLFVGMMFGALLVLLLAGCSTRQVLLDGVHRPLPAEAMKPEILLDNLPDRKASRQELEAWIAKAAAQHGLCVADKSELVDWITKSAADNAPKK